MRVLVTGVTGYIGSAVAEALKARGHAVVGLVRGEQKAAQVRAAGHEAVLGNLTDLDSLRAAAQRVDAVIHAAMQWTPEAGTIDRAAVEALLAAIGGADRAFVYSSGIWVYGDTHGRLCGEVSPLNPAPVVAWRPPVEDLVLEAVDRKIRGVVLRPGMVFGGDRGFLKGMFASAQAEGVVRVIGNGENHWSTVHVADLAELYWRALEKSGPGELFLAAAGMPQQLNKIAAAVAKKASVEGKEVQVEHLSLEAARVQMGPAADAMAMDIKAGSTKAARLLSWGPKRPNVFEEIERGAPATS
jgi:nucleoside-diphosphate-sugar epimerase